MVYTDDTLGSRLRYLRKSYDMSQGQLAIKLNVSRSAVSNWEIDKRKPSNDDLIKIANLFNVSTDYLLGTDSITEHIHSMMVNEGGSSSYKTLMVGETGPTYKMMIDHVTVYGQIPAGVSFEAIEDVLGEIAIPDWLAKKSNLFGLLIKGDSMNRILPDGVIGVFQKCSDLENGEIGAILVNGCDATVKRFYRLTDSVILEPQSLNEEYKPKIIKNGEEEVTILGKLFWYSPLGIVK